MGHHRTAASAFTPWRRLLLGFLLLSVLATVVGAWRLWLSTEAPAVSEEFATTFNLNHTQVTELLRSGIGTLALTMAVPLTSLIAAWTAPDRAGGAPRTGQSVRPSA